MEISTEVMNKHLSPGNTSQYHPLQLPSPRQSVFRERVLILSSVSRDVTTPSIIYDNGFPSSEPYVAPLVVRQNPPNTPGNHLLRRLGKFLTAIIRPLVQSSRTETFEDFLNQGKFFTVIIRPPLQSSRIETFEDFLNQGKFSPEGICSTTVQSDTPKVFLNQ
ncbi:unnamed protein product, partial [Cyprideis torosa]